MIVGDGLAGPLGIEAGQPLGDPLLAVQFGDPAFGPVIGVEVGQTRRIWLEHIGGIPNRVKSPVAGEGGIGPRIAVPLLGLGALSGEGVFHPGHL